MPYLSYCRPWYYEWARLQFETWLNRYESLVCIDRKNRQGFVDNRPPVVLQEPPVAHQWVTIFAFFVWEPICSGKGEGFERWQYLILPDTPSSEIMKHLESRSTSCGVNTSTRCTRVIGSPPVQGMGLILMILAVARGPKLKTWGVGRDARKNGNPLYPLFKPDVCGSDLGNEVCRRRGGGGGDGDCWAG